MHQKKKAHRNKRNAICSFINGHTQGTTAFQLLPYHSVIYRRDTVVQAGAFGAQRSDNTQRTAQEVKAFKAPKRHYLRRLSFHDPEQPLAQVIC